MSQERTKATGSYEAHFPMRASCVGPGRLNNLCSLVSGQGLSVPRMLCFQMRLISAAKSNPEGGDSRGCLLTEFPQQQVTPGKGWSTSTFSTLYHSESEEFILQPIYLFLSKNSRHPAPNKLPSIHQQTQWHKGRSGGERVEVTKNKNGTEEDLGSRVSRESTCHTSTGTQLDHRFYIKAQSGGVCSISSLGGQRN